MLALLSLFTALLASSATAQTVTALSSTQIAALKPFTWFANAAYCAPATTLAWNCQNCGGNPSFIPVASGGDGSLTQFWYVGYDPVHSTVIVGHQGTDPSKILADLTDADFFLSPLSSTLFPGLSSSLLVHNGFGADQARSASAVLAAVQKTISQHATSTVTVVGHSLGAAISLLDAVYLQLHLSGVTVKFYGYGLPRVGNPAFASYVDAHFPNLVTHVNNREDPVPTLPPRLLGFSHPAGEVHITDAGLWEACSGDENTSSLCLLGDSPTIFTSNASDHNGPYDGVTMGCKTS